MAGKSAILSVKIISDAKGVVKGFNETEQAAGGLSGKLAKISPGALAVGGAVVTGAIAVGKELYDLGTTFDSVADTIRTGTGATGEALDGLIDDARKVATSIPTDFETAGSTVADLNTRLGLSGDTLQTVASQYLEAGRILGEDVDINTTSAAFSAFKIEGDNVAGAMDSLFRVSQATGVSMNDLANSSQTNAMTMQELGFTFEDSIALIGSLDKAGVDAGSTLSAMRRGMLNLAEPGESTSEAFKRATGELQGFIDAGDTGAALDLASNIFGTKGAAQMVQALQSGTLNMNDLMSAAGTTGDTILGVGEETMDAGEKWTILKNKGMDALEPVASSLFDGVGAGLDYVLNLVDGFSMQSFLDSVPWVESLVDAAGRFSDTLASVLFPIIETLAPYVLDAFTVIGTYMGDLFNLFSGVVTFVGQIITGDWAGAFGSMGDIVSSAGTLISNLVGGLSSLVGEAISGVVSWIKNVWSNGWSSLARVVSEKASEIFSNITNGLKELPGKMLQTGKDIVNGLIDGIGSMGSALWDAATNIAGKAVDAIKSFLGIHSPSRVGMALGAFFGQGVSLGITSQTGNVSTAGARMVSGLASLEFPSPSQAKGANASDSQPVYNITINGVLDGDDAARKIQKLLSDHARRVGTVRIGAIA